MANSKSSKSGTSPAEKKQNDVKTLSAELSLGANIDMGSKNGFVEQNRVKQVDPDQIVTVRNGFQGKLVYISKRTGEKWVWEQFGAEQDMELSELKNARNSNKKFFINNWFMFDEEWIVDYLGLNQYYKFSIPIDQFDELFEKPVSEIEVVLSNLSDGQKKSIAYRARQLISENRIDSNKTIATLEKHLGIDLVER